MNTMPNTKRTALSTLTAIALVTTTLGLGACAGGGGSGGSGGSGDRIYGEDGFYFDRSINMWRDPDGVICHSCTPENGFEDYSK